MSARPGLCGGHQATGVPTAITGPVNVAGRVPCVTSGRYEGRLYFFAALIFAHRALCAAAIRLRPAADNLCLVPGVFACLTFRFPPPSSRCNTWFSREICSLISCVMDSRLMLPPRFADANEENSTRMGNARRSGMAVLKQLVKFDSIVFR
jgi:hypothetical protein